PQPSRSTGRTPGLLASCSDFRCNVGRGLYIAPRQGLKTLPYKFLLREQFRDLVVPALDRPRQRCGPLRIVWQAFRRAVLEQELDHLELPELGGPGERRRPNVLVARGQIGTRVK